MSAGWIIPEEIGSGSMIRSEDTMKILYQVCGKISLLCYLFLLYQLWHLCQFGGSRRHLLLMLPALLVFAVTLFLWLAARKHAGTEASSGKQRLFRLELIAVLLFTVYFAERIIYSAIPYHGALSWKIDEWMRKKEERQGMGITSDADLPYLLIKT